MNQETLLLLDGHSLAFRSFFALPADSFLTAQGQYTNAVHGFTSTLLKLVGDYQPTHVAVAFDLPGGTFRTRQYAEYKGGRAETPQEFKGQISVIQQVLDVLGVAWLTVEDFEADDIVATLATRGEERGMKVFISSGDKDTYQLVDDAITLVYPMPRSQMAVLDPAGIEAKAGVKPELYSDLAALVGEGADNIPGVPLWGAKTAAKWLNHYGGLENLLEHADEIGGKTGANLRENVEMVRRNRALNTLVRDLPIVEDFDELRPVGVAREEMHELFDTLDFTRLRERVLRELPMRGGEEAVASEPAVEATLVAAGIVPFEEFLAGHEGPWGIEIDGDRRPMRGDVAGYAVASADHHVYYGDRAGLDAADEEALVAFLEDADQPKVGHGTKGLAHAWKGVGVSLAGVVGDTKIGAYLLHPDQRAYDLTDLAQRYLAVDIAAAEDDTLGIGADGAIVHSATAQRAGVLLDLRDAFDQDLRKADPEGALMALELSVAKVLFEMESVGIAVDEDLLESLYHAFNTRVEDAASKAHESIGDDSVNLSSPKQLQEVLFKRMKLPVTKKTKSGYTTNADALAELLAKIAHREDDVALSAQEFLAGLLEHRDALKLRQSVEGLQRSVMSGRIHTTYQQTVAATGRLSSTDPNLQNIHARTEEGRQIRGVFVPGEGYDYVMTADYSQIEMRLMAHLSGDADLIEAFRQGADLHSFVASRVFGVPQESVTGEQRSKIKAMSYGLAYGLSSYGLSQQLHITVPEAEALMKDYDARFGKVRQYLTAVVSQARKDGYTSTIWGRRRYLPGLDNPNRQVREAAERMALNAPIQGSAADIIKFAMVAVHEALASAGLASRVLLQVHDELVLEVKASEAEQVEQIVREEMAKAAELSVPLSVSVGVGRNWRDAAH
ncbi:DNA polymerase I [Trueperella bernardiae]|uniref:DNA polymerase I n=1 Tax=Trueperella bernardiae TaxID=59561 RepID=UPI000C7DD427|nr:DNA polymerase I [Trueperella bernardiae]PKZ90008.1 DNA polymerase I [Trueperella bernardiae]